MDIALLAMKRLKEEGKLSDQEESEEINACSIVVPAEVDGKTEEWLVNFKNETHNHPTEIEPFGGAATRVRTLLRPALAERSAIRSPAAPMYTRQCVLLVQQILVSR